MTPALVDRPLVAHRSATGRPMPIKKVRLEFDDDGYPEWYADVRTNVRGSVMDDYRSGEQKPWWRAIGQIVLDWNFCTEDGTPIPLPAELTEEVDEAGDRIPKTMNRDLPEDLLGALLQKFREAFNAQSQPPKERSEISTPTSTTSP